MQTVKESKQEKAAKKLKAEQNKAKKEGFHHANTVEVEINGKKKRVNKFEAEKLVKKLKDGPRKSAAAVKGVNSSAALEAMQKQLNEVAALAKAQAQEIADLKAKK